MSKPLFDIVMIMKNEARTLPRLLSSLSDFKERGGSVYIVDTGSTDDSVKIAREWGCIVEEVGDRFKITINKENAKAINDRFLVSGEEPIVKDGDTFFDFASARNHAHSLATQDWCWAADADEQATVLDIDQLNEVMQNAMIDRLVYRFNFSPTITFSHSKLYRRSRNKWRGIVHEILVSTNGNTIDRFLPPNVILLEHFQQNADHRSNYLKGLAYAAMYNSAAESPDRSSHYLARELFYTGRLRSAIKEFKHHISMNAWEPERSQSYVFMGECHEVLKEDDLAVECWHKSIQVHAERRAPFIKLAEHYYKKNDHQRVALYAEAALSIKESSFYANDLSHYRDTPHAFLYWAYFYLGKKVLAEQHFLKALEFDPYNPKYLFESRYFMNLPKVSFVIPSLGRPEGLKNCIESLKSLNYPKELLEFIIVSPDAPEQDSVSIIRAPADMTVPNKVKVGFEASSGDYIAYAANDTIFTPDSLIIAVLASKRLNKGLVAFHSEALLPDEGNICCHFIIKKELISRIGGEIFCTKIHHCGVDNLLWAKCKKIEEAHHEDCALIDHVHFSSGKSEYDWVYEKGWSKRDDDLKILFDELSKL